MGVLLAPFLLLSYDDQLKIGHNKKFWMNCKYNGNAIFKKDEK